MANGSVYVDEQIKGSKGNVISIGRVLLGVSDSILPGDLEMKTVKTIVFTPWDQGRFVPGSVGPGTYKGWTVMSGSIDTPGSFQNSVSVRTQRVELLTAGTINFALGIGTQHIGSGSFRANFIAVGN